MQRVVDISLQRAQFPMRYNRLLAVNEVSTLAQAGWSAKW